MKGFIYGENITLSPFTQKEGSYSFIPSTGSSPARNSNTCILSKILVRGTCWLDPFGPDIVRPVVNQVPFQVTVCLAKNPVHPPTVPTSIWATTNPSGTSAGMPSQVQNPSSDGYWYEMKTFRGIVKDPATQVYHVSPNNWYMVDGDSVKFEIVIDCDLVCRFLDGTGTRPYVNAPWLRFSSSSSTNRNLRFNYNVRYDYREVAHDTLEFTN